MLARITAAGVTPLDHTILSGHYKKAKALLVLGNEGAGVVEEGGGPEFPAGSRVMFTGLYGVAEDGTYAEWLAVRKQDLRLIPDGTDDANAAGIPVAYLTAQSGKSVLAPAIGGSVGNAVTQVAHALGAKHAISSTTSHSKALRAKALGFTEIIDGSRETLGDGVRRITGGDGVDIVIDAIGGEIFSEALTTLPPGGNVITLGYSAGRKTTIDVTDVIWKAAAIRGSCCLPSRRRFGGKRGRTSSNYFNRGASSQSWQRHFRWQKLRMPCAALSRNARSAGLFSPFDGSSDGSIRNPISRWRMDRRESSSPREICPLQVARLSVP